ncbi:MAG: hypothetical protein K0B10_07225 [Vicingaceae bacterium]|nr:hypothetical protein [Vicingaceae bacterium]
MKIENKIAELEAENKKLKALIVEGKKVFTTVNEVLGIEKAANSGFFAAKIGSIIMKVQKQPEIIEELADYLQKIEQLEV